MAIRDYIVCAECDCKLIYDGNDQAREWLEECYGDPTCGCYTAEIICPDCLKKLRTELEAANSILADIRKAAKFNQSTWGHWIKDMIDKHEKGGCN